MQRNAALVEETTASVSAVDGQVQALVATVDMFQSGDGEAAPRSHRAAPASARSPKFQLRGLRGRSSFVSNQAMRLLS